MVPTVWTNEARHPSRVKERGFEVTNKITGQLVDDCAAGPIAAAVSSSFEPRPLFVGNNAISSGYVDFDTTMLMSFNKESKDEVQLVTPGLSSPFIGELYSYKCNGNTHYVGYMPNCGNLAKLIPKAPQYPGGVFGGGVPESGVDTFKSHSIDAPGSVVLLLLGLVLVIAVKLIKA